MKYIRLFENYKDESKEISELIGTKDPNTGREIKFAVEFYPDGTFGAISKASSWLKGEGYVVGTMCGHEPIGIARDVGYIAKWINLDYSDKKLLDGIIISDDFREGGVKVLFFNDFEFDRELRNFNI
jgi:hypothetical protein